MFFKKKDITMEYAKDKLLSRINIMNPKIKENSEKRLYISIFLKGRIIEITLNEFSKKSITLDVIDSFGFIAIPRKTFTQKKEFEEFIRTIVMQKLN